MPVVFITVYDFSFSQIAEEVRSGEFSGKDCGYPIIKEELSDISLLLKKKARK